MNCEISNVIRKQVINLLPSLNEISKELAVNSPKYLMFCYFDGSKKYFEYNQAFGNLFTFVKEYKIDEFPNLQKDSFDKNNSIQKTNNFVEKSNRKLIHLVYICVLLLIFGFAFILTKEKQRYIM